MIRIFPPHLDVICYETLPTSCSDRGVSCTCAGASASLWNGEYAGASEEEGESDELRVREHFRMCIRQDAGTRMCKESAKTERQRRAVGGGERRRMLSFRTCSVRV